ncbi:MAG TPA: class I SAM-dependent methyltransferase [Usitatibacter sp.]|nr:class I SAM-dependent methyltransferase [Usitatibacter sp.]
MTLERVDFLCNVCGRRNFHVPREQVENRETQTCAGCHGNLRMRALMYALGVELFGSPRVLPAFPVDKRIRGVGLSDWEGYAERLEEKFDYINTFYHAEPRLDIAAIPEELVGQHDFVIATDVFEHIPPQALDRAFANLRRLLRAGGVLVFSVPFNKLGETHEHFPRLHDFRIVEEGGKRVLLNRTADGREERFENLNFHGGEGLTLEMRIFSEPDLLRRFTAAGFSSAAVRRDHAPHFGLMWPIELDHSLPMVARA